MQSEKNIIICSRNYLKFYICDNFAAMKVDILSQIFIKLGNTLSILPIVHFFLSLLKSKFIFIKIFPLHWEEQNLISFRDYLNRLERVVFNFNFGKLLEFYLNSIILRGWFGNALVKRQLNLRCKNNTVLNDSFARLEDPVW